MCSEPKFSVQPGACVLPLSGAEGLQVWDVAELQDARHALAGEHAAPLKLPVLVLLQQHRPHQAGDQGVVGFSRSPAPAGCCSRSCTIDPLNYPAHSATATQAL